MPLHVRNQGIAPVAELEAMVQAAERDGESVVQVIDFANAWLVVTTPAPPKKVLVRRTGKAAS